MPPLIAVCVIKPLTDFWTTRGRKKKGKRYIKMASWIEVETGSTVKLPSTLESETWVSYKETYYGVNIYDPVIRWKWKTATIKATYFIGNAVGYIVDAVGKYCDVLVAIEVMETQLGAVDLKPKLKVPTLTYWVRENVLEFFKTRFGSASKPISDEDIKQYMDEGILVLIFDKKMGLEKSIRKAMEIVRKRFTGIASFRFDNIEMLIYSNEDYDTAKNRYDNFFQIRYPLRAYIKKIITSIKK